MKIMKVAAMLLACTQGTSLENQHQHRHSKASGAIDEKEQRLSQSFVSAFKMSDSSPKLMNKGDLPEAGKGGCPGPAKELKHADTGGAFLDGCYMNTTRKEGRNEQTGEEAQHYLYMWKHACAFTKWVPSNQFMYSNLDYNDQTMTLERFGFIGMDKRCFWGAIGVLWKRPLPVQQILPNTTLTSEVKPEPPKPEEKEEKEEAPKPYVPPTEDVTPKRKNGVFELQSRVNPGNDIEISVAGGSGGKTYAYKTRVENKVTQHWWFFGISEEVYVIKSENFQNTWFSATENEAEGKHVVMKESTESTTDKGTTGSHDLWFRTILIKKDGDLEVYAMESILFPGHYIEDPGQNDVSSFKLTAVANIMTANEKFFINIVKYHD